MKYAVNEQGVQALQQLAAKLPEEAEKIKNAVTSLQSAFDENQAGLGPHDNSIENILEEMNQIEASVSDPVRKVSDILNDIADSYQNLIETNGYDSVGNAGN